MAATLITPPLTGRMQAQVGLKMGSWVGLEEFEGEFLGGVGSRLANDGEWQGEGGVALATGCNVSQAETQSVTHMVQLCKVDPQVQTQINLPGFFFKISLPSIFRFIKQN